MENRRIWEIDLLRTIAIILMVVFHVIYDLNQFFGVKIEYLSGFWYWEGRAAALIFIFLAGISSGFSRNTVRRGLQVFSFGMAITLVTYILFDEQYIRFGILHLLGTAMILFPLLKKINNILLFMSAAGIVFTGMVMKNTLAATSLLLPLGVRYKGFISLDYYPLCPFLMVFILGILAYKMFYYARQSLFSFGFENKYILLISKNSLLIYLIHQPLVIGLIFLLQHICGGNYGLRS